jgi:hypothetical protein
MVIVVNNFGRLDGSLLGWGELGWEVDVGDGGGVCIGVGRFSCCLGGSCNAS